MIEHTLGHVGAAVEPIQNAQPRARQSRGVHEPPEERRRLVTTAELEERFDREGGVTDPAVAIVPVALAADRLRQGRRRCRRDGAGWREDEQLERERATHDSIAPGTGVREPCRPPLPEGRGTVEPRFDMGARGKDEWLVARGDEAQESTAARRHLEPSAHAAVTILRRSRAPARERDAVGAVGGHRNLAAALEARALSVLEARRGSPFHRHPAAQTFHSASQLTQGDEVCIGQRHGVGDTDAAAGRGERGFEHVGARSIAPLRLVALGGVELEAAPTLGVEDGGEDTGRIHVRQAEPVDGSVPGHQRDRPSITDHRIVANRRVPTHRFKSTDCLGGGTRPGGTRSACPQTPASRFERAGARSRLLHQLQLKTPSSLRRSRRGRRCDSGWRR